MKSISKKLFLIMLVIVSSIVACCISGCTITTTTKYDEAYQAALDEIYAQDYWGYDAAYTYKPSTSRTVRQYVLVDYDANKYTKVTVQTSVSSGKKHVNGIESGTGTGITNKYKETELSTAFAFVQCVKNQTIYDQVEKLIPGGCEAIRAEVDASVSEES